MVLHENVTIEKEISPDVVIVGVGDTLWEAVLDGAEAEALAVQSGVVTSDQVANAPTPKVVSV